MSVAGSSRGLDRRTAVRAELSRQADRVFHRVPSNQDPSIALLPRQNSLFRSLGGLAALLLFTELLCHVSAGIDLERMRASMAAHGPGALSRYAKWRQLVVDSRDRTEMEKLARVNDFFNRNLQFADDVDAWGMVDYWASPVEFIQHGMGDCEDFAIAKYFTLREIGVPERKLRLTYVRAVVGGPSSRISVEHMVLAYYDTTSAEPLVLDSLISEIRPAGLRKDLLPVISFNGQGMWASGAQYPAPVDRLTRWTTLRLKMQSEGYEP